MQQDAIELRRASDLIQLSTQVGNFLDSTGVSSVYPRRNYPQPTAPGRSGWHTIAGYCCIGRLSS